MDHFGFAVGSMEELQGVQERAEAFRAEDDRVDLIDLHTDDQTGGQDPLAVRRGTFCP